jgi:oligopeptide transport system permease protein
VDGAMMRVIDVLFGLPVLAYVMLMVIVLRDVGVEAFGIKPADRWLWELLVMTVALGSMSWLNVARIVRAQMLQLRESEYVEAARALGAGHLRVIFRHAVPNLLGPVIVYATLTAPSVMLFESFISFLGLGIQPPHSSLGLLLDDGVKRIAATNINWWLLVFPGGLLAALLFCLNIIGDGLRDAFDVRATE